MKKRLLLRGTTWTAVLFAGLATAFAQGEGVAPELATRGQVSAERRLPPKVFAYVSVPSVERLKGQWGATQFGKLLADPGLAEFRLDLEKQIAGAAEEIERNLGIPLENLLAIPSGEITFAVAQPADSIAIVALLDFGRSRADVDKLLEKAEADLKTRNAERSSSEFEGTQVITWKIPAEGGEEAPADGGKFSYFIKDTHFAVASDTAMLEAILARWNGRHEQTFADNELHRYIQSRCTTPGGSPVAVWFVDLIGLVKAALSAGGEETAQAVAMMDAYLPQLGLNGLKAIGGTAELATTEFDTVSRTFIYIEPPAEGVLKLFQFPAAELVPPTWVTADAAAYSAWNWDVAGAYDAVEKLVDQFMGEGSFKMLVDSIPQRPGAPNVHPKADFIDQLTGRMHYFSDFTDLDDIESGRILVALEVKDAAKMKSVLATIAQTEGAPVKSRDFQGETIYELDQEIPGANEGMQIAVGVAHGHLMFVTQATLLEQVLRNDKDRQPLAESAAYKKVAAHFPARVSVISYSKDAAGLQGAYQTLRSGGLEMAIPGIDFRKLPPFEDLKKYFSESGGYTVPDRNGGLSVTFTLKAESR